MSLTFKPVRVATGYEEDGMLVFADERLVAVLVHLSDGNEVAPGHWFLEAAFGPLDEPDFPLFPDLDAAEDWIGEHLAISAS
jgi:hypothetical protein